MILTYILTFSLLITSVIKFVKVMKFADDRLNEKKSEFINQTKKTHQDGSITLMAVLLTFMISSLLLFYSYKLKLELKEAHYRKDSYLCFHYLNIKTENYIAEMSKFNIMLRSAYAAMYSGAATAQAKAVHQTLVVVRDARHFYYIKDLIFNEYCKKTTPNFSYLKNLPYQTNHAYMLSTNIDSSSKLRDKKWITTYYKVPIGVRLKNTFCLKAQMSAESAFIANFKIKTSEVSMRGFSQLKCLSGSP